MKISRSFFETPKLWACKTCASNNNLTTQIAGIQQMCELGFDDCELYAYARYTENSNGYKLYATMVDITP